eukprot:319397_1
MSNFETRAMRKIKVCLLLLIICCCLLILSDLKLLDNNVLEYTDINYWNTINTTEKHDYSRFGYAFYATKYEYLCSAFVAIESLLNTNILSEYDIIIIIPKPNIRKILITVKMQQYINITNTNRIGNIIIKNFTIPRELKASKSFYKYTLLKLTIFQLYQYKRIIYIDSDSLILKNLDHLFLLNDNITIAAPQAIWLDKNVVTSMLLVVKPNQIFYEDILIPKFNNNSIWIQKYSNYYDMDFINDYLNNELFILSHKYGALNSFFVTNNDSITVYAKESNIAIKDVFVVHFTAKGKPWSYMINPHWMNDTTKIFYKLHYKWHTYKDRVC